MLQPETDKHEPAVDSLAEHFQEAGIDFAYFTAASAMDWVRENVGSHPEWFEPVTSGTEPTC